MRDALRDLTDGIRWRALTATWVLTLVTVAILALADASQPVVSLALGGAAAVVALCVAGDALASPARRIEPPVEPEAPAKPEPPPARVSPLRPPAARGLPSPSSGPPPRAGKAALAYNIRRLRKQQGWSQEQLAHMAAMRPDEIARFERGLHDPRLRAVLRLAAALRVPVEELLLLPEEREEEDEPASASPPRSEDD